MKVTWYGHACFGIEINGKHLLFDPYIAANPLAAHIDVESIKADFILQSHGHFDHISDTVAIAKRTGAVVVGPYEVTEWVKKHGVEKVHPMNVGGQWQFDFGKLKCVNAVHSSMMPDGSYGGIPMGFVIESVDGNFYFAGDTALTYDMKLIGEYMKIDFAILPIGDNFTMGIDNALIASDFVKCNDIIGMHFNTHGYIQINQVEAIEKFSQAGKKLTLLKIGETIIK